MNLCSYVSSWSRFLGCFFIVVFVVACNRSPSESRKQYSSVASAVPGCRKYLDFLRSESKYSEVTSWADKEIFSKNSSDLLFKVGWFSGPGLAPDTIDLERSDISIPDWLSGYRYEVRLVALRRSDFDAIFIGGGKYKGLLIMRADFVDRPNDGFLSDVKFKAKRDRIGLVCYEDEQGI